MGMYTCLRFVGELKEEFVDEEWYEEDDFLKNERRR